jgi:hypothetical protein
MDFIKTEPLTVIPFNEIWYMIRKFFEKIRFWDFKSFFATVIFLAILGSIYFYLHTIRSNFREEKIKSLTGETDAKIVSAEGIEMMSQSRRGAKFYIDHYKVNYHYNINGKDYRRTDLISVSPENKKLIHKILNRTSGDRFRIKYDFENPSKSVIYE